MEILDTQVISYASKGANVHPVTGRAISTITPGEFLTIKKTLRPGSKCFLPLPQYYVELTREGTFHRRDHPYNKKATDSLILNFGSSYPILSYDGYLALSHIINQRMPVVFEEAIKFGVTKQERKSIMRRLDFLLQHQLVCLPLNPRIVDITMSLVESFEGQFNAKQDSRNTCNDLLILSTAVDSSSMLITHDSVLRRFAAAQCRGRIKTEQHKLLIDFPVSLEQGRTPSRESKGYINRGWQAPFRNYRNASR
jgi:hypothetical protein